VNTHAPAAPVRPPQPPWPPSEWPDARLTGDADAALCAAALATMPPFVREALRLLAETYLHRARLAREAAARLRDNIRSAAGLAAESHRRRLRPLLTAAVSYLAVGPAELADPSETPEETLAPLLEALRVAERPDALAESRRMFEAAAEGGRP
jgi:hypothetical protein